VVQRDDYSDIEQRFTNYGQLMLDLDKQQLMQRRAEFVQMQLKK
jgi:hypothetical protein